MNDIESFRKPKRIGEFWFENPDKKVGIWRLPRAEGGWSIGVEFIDSLEEYSDSSITLQDFLRSKKAILQGLYLNMVVPYSGQNREMIFLHEDAIFDIFLLQYSTKSIALKYQKGARAKFNDVRKNGIAFRGDIEEKLQDPYEQRKLMLEMLVAINEEQRTLKDGVQELEENYLVLAEKLKEDYISLPNRDRLIAIIHQIHLNSRLSHKEIWGDIYNRFNNIPKPKSNLSRINFILDSQVPAIVKYLEEKYKLISFYMKQEGEEE